ncbi:hypothetical protein WOLCODRAFT_23656 [Wolfiporia cocos MD-104 SS10]|uniref:BZIP domain-containing protein n=1 Tax=Wolfiporia cocos (strain MD-104) TaxID=742152 RepID=A0A2H3JC55_WOLCO|nr:hypothetical protein WOLCODRAFT_23656 [Wolfiporia cocos MD-104 SS10]
MLSQKPEEGISAVSSTADASNDNGAAVQALMEVLQASPEFNMANDFNEYLTSPMEDSPWDDFLTTPALGSAEMNSEFLTSPAIVDADDFNDFGGASLFDDSLELTAACESQKPSAPATSLPPQPFNFEGMYTIPSPTTPALDPTSLHPSPRVPAAVPPSTPAASARQSRRLSAPTGTRKNLTPEALVPIDAPIQPRKYVTPSATSRKEVPAVFAKKRARSQAFGEEDEIDTSNLPQSDLDAIEAKRRQNTLAARRSRKRKLEYQRELEITVEQERTEKEMWKARAQMFEALLRSHNLEVPVFQ